MSFFKKEYYARCAEGGLLDKLLVDTILRLQELKEDIDITCTGNKHYWTPSEEDVNPNWADELPANYYRTHPEQSPESS